MEKFMKYMGVFMALVYIGLGIIVVQGGNRIFELPEKMSMVLGLVFIGYGSFRAWRVFRKHFSGRS